MGFSSFVNGIFHFECRILLFSSFYLWDLLGSPLNEHTRWAHPKPSPGLLKQKGLTIVPQALRRNFTYLRTDRVFQVQRIIRRFQRGFSAWLRLFVHKMRGLVRIHSQRVTQILPKTWEDNFLGIPFRAPPHAHPYPQPSLGQMAYLRAVSHSLSLSLSLSPSLSLPLGILKTGGVETEGAIYLEAMWVHILYLCDKGLQIECSSAREAQWLGQGYFSSSSWAWPWPRHPATPGGGREREREKKKET